MSSRFQQLADELVDMVETATTAPAVPEADVRRLLQFVVQVVHVVEQAFQDALTLLVDVSAERQLHLPSDDN